MSWTLALPGLLAGLALTAPPAQAQSPWTLNRSGFYFQDTFSYLSTDEFYDDQGEKQSLGDGFNFRDASNSLYLEYGIRDRLGLVLSLPVKSLQLEQGGTLPNLDNTGFGDLTGGLKYRVLAEPLVTSVQAEIKLPSGYNATITQPPLGDGQTDFTGRLLLGRSLYPLPGFVQGGLGYRLRGKRGDFQPADEIVVNLDGGFWVHEKVLLIGRWDYTEHQGDGAIEDRFGGSLTAQVRVSPYVDVVGGVGRIFGGQNTTAGNQLLLGIAFKGNQLGKYEGAISSTTEGGPPKTKNPEKWPFIPQGEPPPPPPADTTPDSP